MKKIFLFISLFACSANVMANGSKAENKLSCKWESKTFSITPSSNGEYNIGIFDEKMASNFTFEGMKKQFPNMDDTMISVLVAEAQKTSVGREDFGNCSQVQNCEFFEVGQPTLVNCTIKSDDVTRTFTVSEKDGSYGATCTTEGPVDSKTMGIEFKGKGTVTSTYRFAIPINSCMYE